MPELPEVEVVRRGLAPWTAGRRVEIVDVLDPRSVRRHDAGAQAFADSLSGALLGPPTRRGKFLWFPLLTSPDAAPTEALLIHLGMSGQVLLQPDERDDEKHLRIRLTLSPSDDAPSQMRFVDQRIFGGMRIDPLQATDDGAPAGCGSELALIPVSAAHIARDPLDPAFDVEALYRRLRARRTGLKRALLDQSLISGIGNIYADEALWAARLHGARPTATLRRPELYRLVDAVRAVMNEALEAGGTSFDALYVNVNGQSGYFDRSLNVYGQTGRLCPRCEANGRHSVIRRDSFMGRGSFTCPVCQRRPRNAHD